MALLLETMKSQIDIPRTDNGLQKVMIVLELPTSALFGGNHARYE